MHRSRRWVETGVFEALLQVLADLVEQDQTAVMIDSAIVRAHHFCGRHKTGLGRSSRLVDHATASPPGPMLGAMQRAADQLRADA
ncbi:hypothetical protein U2P60_03505 [Brucella sp. H1_1004]|uniref:hypothetical protein n=1 Tax=Brucella sp. H1_1004 TaxID=3110109 RepID=UPI0039B44BC0